MKLNSYPIDFPCDKARKASREVECSEGKNNDQSTSAQGRLLTSQYVDSHFSNFSSEILFVLHRPAMQSRLSLAESSVPSSS
ncbi:hypothetical protein SUGI_0752800 [Cryptomeria japonica]|nr:hypothetical protein SUGI_0752800 [Cryptomeria japonica]